MPTQSIKILPNLTNAKTRTFVILFGIIFIIGIFIAFSNKKEKGSDILSQQPSQATGVPSSIKAVPGSTVSPEYKKIQLAENDRRAQLASKSQTSAIPTILGATEEAKDLSAKKNKLPDTENNFGLFSKSAAERERERQEALVKQEHARIEKIRNEKENAQLQMQMQERQRLAEQQAQKSYDDSLRKISDQMRTYSADAYKEWKTIPKQHYVEGVLASKNYRPNGPDAITSKGDHVSISHSSSRTGSAHIGSDKVKKVNPKLVIKAGTILFGVMDTSINSDEPGPVLATVVSGKFNGAKLVGSLKHSDKQETVSVTFNQMNIPKRLHSVNVSVVAIDPETARTALASSVNHHYLFRYGTLFASAFIQGYGSALQQQGSTTTTSPLTGATTTSYPPLDNRQIFLSALGQVGTAWASATRPYFNTPYTVKVDQGTGVGLLFMADADLNLTD